MTGPIEPIETATDAYLSAGRDADTLARIVANMVATDYVHADIRARGVGPDHLDQLARAISEYRAAVAAEAQLRRRLSALLDQPE